MIVFFSRFVNLIYFITLFCNTSNFYTQQFHMTSFSYLLQHLWIIQNGEKMLRCTFLVCPKTIVFGRTSVLRMMLFFVNHQISEMRGPTGVKFCTMVSTGLSFIMPVQNFGGHTPKKFHGPKTCKIWPDFRRLRSSAANISETDEDIQNRIVIPCMAIPPALGETSTVKFGPVTLEI